MKKSTIMSGTLSLALLGYVSLNGIQVYGDNNSVERSTDESPVTVKLGAMRITNSALELRCEVKNGTREDIWVYTGSGYEEDLNDVHETNAKLFMSKDGKSILVLRRINLPLHHYVMGHVNALYVRLAAGQSRPESFLIRLPVIPDSAQGFHQAIEQGIEEVGELGFEIGYYTATDLASLKADPRSHQGISVRSPNVVAVYDITHGSLPHAERVTGITVDGLSIPYKQWLYFGTPETPNPPTGPLPSSLQRISTETDYDHYQYANRLFLIETRFLNESARRITDVYLRLAEGRIDPARFRRQLDGIMSRSGRIALLRKLEREQAAAYAPKIKLATVQVLEDLFYQFRLDEQEYRYAKRLFGIDDDLFNAVVRQIIDVYHQVAQARLDPAQLTRHLDKAFDKSKREKLLHELQEKQVTVECRKQDRFAALLADARHYDTPAEGCKALVLLEEALAIDPSHQEAFDLMRKISGYYQGEVIQNSIGMQLVWIPAGEFLMGKEGLILRQFAPPHKVKITRGFWMAAHEVSQAQYEAVMDSNPSSSKNNEPLPVADVSWEKAVEFCRRLSRKEGRAYRLPTEAEWEYACRAGTNTDCWRGRALAQDSDKANPFGLFGMHTGVGEWCRDWFSSGYYVESPCVNPQGPQEPDAFRGRVVRGYPSADHARDSQSTCYERHHWKPDETNGRVGFRIVLEGCSNRTEETGAN